MKTMWYTKTIYKNKQAAVTVLRKGRNMIDFLKCIFMIMAFLVIFILFGYLGSCLIKRKSSLVENLVLGVFVYFALFQLFALPLILLKQHLTLLADIWVAVVASVLLCSFRVLYKNKTVINGGGFKRILLDKKSIVCYLSMAVMVLFFCYFTAIQNYWGWDTAFYIGTISTTVDTDTMYLINGENGTVETALSLRYALSGFYMNSAVFCKVTGISAVKFQKYVMGTLDVVLYFSIIYLLGKTLFCNSMTKIAGFIWSVGLVNLFFVSEYTTSQFLILRAYEAKSYCANVVLPAILLMILLLHKDIENRANWKAMFVIMLASVPVSMSSILIAPAMLGIAVLGESIVNKNSKVLVRGMVCMIPNMVYLVMYLLYTLGIFVIKV